MQLEKQETDDIVNKLSPKVDKDAFQRAIDYIEYLIQMCRRKMWTHLSIK